LSTSEQLEGFLVRDRLEDLVMNSGGWDYLEPSGYWANRMPDGVKVVEKFLDEGNEDYGDSPHMQGHEGTCFVVVEFEGRFFRKTGSTDSYAHRSWDGRLREVKRGQVEVIKYQWVEETAK